MQALSTEEAKEWTHCLLHLLSLLLSSHAGFEYRRGKNQQTVCRVLEPCEFCHLQALTVEEAQERRERLAKMRSLLFAHEQKAKRLKAIKSKGFHRHAKKAAKMKVCSANFDNCCDAQNKPFWWGSMYLAKMSTCCYLFNHLSCLSGIG